MALAALREERLPYDAAVAGNPPGSEQPATRALTEDLLAHLWAGQRFPESALITTAGVPLRVLHPGWRGRGAGPDVRAALIAPPSGRLLRGDVELHVRASDFRAHGHASDPRYDGLVLHVVFDDDGDGETRLACGRTVPVVALAPWLRRRERELAGWLATPSLWREPCADAIARLGGEEVLRTLAALGDERFAAREEALGRAIEASGAAAALYGGLLEGLGYGGARELITSIALTLPWAALSDALASSDERAELAETLLIHAASGELTITFRPANHPARRLAGLARLLARHWPLEDVALAEQRALIVAWTVAARSGGAALIGRSRAIELLTNAVLPWRAALCRSRGDVAGAAQARAAFAALPRPGRYGNLAFLETNLRTDGRPLPLDARHQQGLLALYKSECTQGGCGRCVLS